MTAPLVDGEKYDIVDSFCYLGGMLSVEGVEDAALTTTVCMEDIQAAETLINVQRAIYEDGGLGSHGMH